MFTDSIKKNPIAWGIGAVVVAFVIYAGVDWMAKRKNAVVDAKVAQSAPMPVQAPAAVPARGKLPWAVGDVDIWAEEKKA